jgi:hypothetical protein
MPIIGTLPNIIQNGQVVDANPVMADLNYIVNQVNANGNPAGTLTAPTGTRVVFQQSAAPLGWTADATITDHTLQLTAASGAIVATGNQYSGLFSLPWVSDGHSLTIAELAAHAHNVSDPQHNHTSPGHQHGTASGNNFWTATPTGGASVNLPGGANSINQETLTNAVAVSINSSATGISIQNNGSGNAHSHTKTFNVNYAQGIVGVKA